MSEQNERYEVEHGGDTDHGGNHRPAIAPPPEEPSVCGSNLECPDVLHQALNFPISLSIFQFFNFSIFFGRNQSIDGRRRRQARRTLPFGSRRRACERPERASARTKSGAMIPRKKQRAKRLPGANAHFFSRRIGPSASGSMRRSEAVALRLQYRESDEYSEGFASFGAVVHLKKRPNRLHADMLNMLKSD